MSQSYYVKIRKEYDNTLLNYYLEKKARRFDIEQRGENLWYYWMPNQSTRGVDVSIEKYDWMEIRNTTNSNEADYRLSNAIAEAICEAFDGTLYASNEDFNEEDAHSSEYLPKTLPIYEESTWRKRFVSDCNLIKMLVNRQNSDISIFGPIREVHFGPNIIHNWSNLDDEAFANAMEDKILEVNYKLPNYEYGNIMQMGEGEEKKMIKLLNNTTCLIDKYDYLLLPKKEEQSTVDYIFITNKDLNMILPKEWTRIDEYHIHAPELPEEAFEALISRALPFNRIGEIKKKG